MVSGRVLLLHLSLNTAGHASREEDSPPSPPVSKALQMSTKEAGERGRGRRGERGEGLGESNAGGTLLAVGVRARLRNWG